ncbi:probable DNA metabolism protein [Sporolituus thermophilus DSM 23256]|uniref:Probable DNA metabolism protein n=1 Tax=Sporolituus thermophilus DSM 23256 TaxID=1123285 RepID=A0A1G7KEV5_9FIRM|nr:probable DNA metabolism protein [Sporolituus thermophilus DSM 23256]
MIVISCSPTPGSILKAAILAQIHNDLPCFKGDHESLGLFMYTDQLDADHTSLPCLVKQLRQNCGLDANWLLDSPGRTLARLIAANLRYASPDRAAVIFAAAEQALRYGHAYCLCGVSDVSRLFINRARAIAREVHKMLGFIRFQPAPDGALVARPKLFHDTADLILRKFADRYPKQRLVLLLDGRALALENGRLFTVPVADYLAHVAGDEFTQAWETYYQSQYIATRKNIALAKRVIPKKYWDWLAEGQILAREAST